MKSTLVIGAGNPLMGDEGVGWHAAERLARDPRLPHGVEVICGGTDLLRHVDRMAGRCRVIVLDALQDAAEPGRVVVLGEDGEAPAERQEHAHHLNVRQSLKLLEMTVPARFTLIGITISSASFGTQMSAGMEVAMPEIVNRVLALVSERIVL